MIKAVNLILVALLIVSCQNKKEDTSKVEIGQNNSSMGVINYQVSNNHSDKCPENMVEIEGDFCQNLEETCLKFGDPDNKGANGPVQCLEFKFPTRCLSEKRIHLHYCIDLYPLPNVKGELPTTQMTWYDVKNVCENQGKRLCSRKEFTQACRGPKDNPYPYGYKRDCSDTGCNCDQTPWVDPATHPFKDLDKRVPLGSRAGCKSDYGVMDMVGNNDRFVYNEFEKPYKSALMGGHAVEGARNRCSPATLVHGPTFSYYETGGVCCKDIK